MVKDGGGSEFDGKIRKTIEKNKNLSMEKNILKKENKFKKT